MDMFRFVSLFVLIMFSQNLYAGPYLELGISKADGGTCIQDEKTKTVQFKQAMIPVSYMGCSESPLGSVAIGYSYKGFSAEIEHYSSLQEKDKGLNLISIKYRIGK